MTLGSLFDGSGGFPLAGALAGIEPVWAAEVEPYPIAVTRSRFPQMRHLGSVTGVHGDEVQPVDVITFGSPCQDLSVAGRRAGIHDGQRSNLFFEAIRIIKEMREATNGRYPAFAIWENVPGAFSGNKGEDFRCVLENFAKINEGGYTVPRPANGKWMGAGEIVGDGFSVAWRVLDAQYWGVPQRRRRIYLVADFAGGRAGKILFERESLRGHPAQGGALGKGAAADAPGSTRGSRGIACLNPWDAQTIRQYAIDGVFPALGANSGDGAHCPTLTGDHENRVTDYTAVAVYRSPKIGEYAADGTASTMVARDFKSPRDLVVEHPPAYGVDCRNAVLDEKKNAHAASQGNGGQSLNCTPCVLTSGKPPRKYIIRRLTPLECCRLQGFPDGWGDIPQKESMTNDEVLFWESVLNTRNAINGKQEKRYAKASILKWYNRLHTDSAEYKMWGNGIALPCAEYVMEGIAEELKEVVQCQRG